VIERTIEIVNSLGLHARPAAQFVRTASRFESRVTIRAGDRSADAKSLMGVLVRGRVRQPGGGAGERQ
jgi:phosphocarrier protein